LKIEYEGGMKVVINRGEAKKLVRIFFDNQEIAYDLQTERVVFANKLRSAAVKAAAERYCEENREFLLSQWDLMNP
jgi:hypothetical protein